MARISLLHLIFMTSALLSCSNQHLIEERSYRETVLNDFHLRSDHYGDRRSDLFTLADTCSNIRQREAMQFLLAYMPLSDLSCYTPEFMKANVDAALKTRGEMKWGPEVPYNIFLHFVLPLRVNNENPDSFRLIYSNELKERISGLDGLEAALEINHWCHEKVAYQPADIRTSAPMATILSARGRCGEESTFTVSALRAAGLPARQVYTPRWAHSDDNHAWVEVWIDGVWYYMGACEPEPVPDRGWFTVPATRAMLIHTRAFGRYNGIEPLVKREALYSEINTLSRYAETKDLKVYVKEDDNLPVPGANVEYLLYNYAEFYPIASLTADETGISTFSTGIGSLLVWARKGEMYGFELVDPRTDSIIVHLSSEHPLKRLEFDLEAPYAGMVLPGPSENQLRENTQRLALEDSIRLAYTATWLENVSLHDLSAKTGLDSTRLSTVLEKSMGNWRSIVSFLILSGDKSALALRLLEKISEKDLRDTPPDILMDHITNAPENIDGYEPGFYDEWILSPRIAEEILTPFRSSMLALFSTEHGAGFANPDEMARWIESNVSVDDAENYYGTPITPPGVEKLRTSDHRSRDILFVALCRTAGYPARLEPGTGRPQYFDDGKWTDVWFTDAVKPADIKSYVTFTSEETNPLPEYHIHFTLARYEEGRYRTLDFGENIRIGSMQKNIPLDPGRYMLVTGNRDETGNVLAGLDFFELLPGESTTIKIGLRHSGENIRIRGKIDTGRTVTLLDEKIVPLPSIMEKGIVILWIDPGTEPTRHIFKDLPLLGKEFNEWGGYLLFMLNPGSVPDSFDPSEVPGLPHNSIFGLDIDHSFLKSDYPSKYSDLDFPVVIYTDNQGNILFASEGYRIGIGEQILKTIK